MIRVALYGTFITAASLGIGGCAPAERPPTNPSQYTSPYAPPTPAGSASTAGTPAPAPARPAAATRTEVGRGELLQGSLGDVPSFASNEPELQVRGSETHATVRLDHVDAAARVWAMTTLTIQGGLGHPALRPGAHLTFGPSAPRGPDGLLVSALGCSGPARDRFTYDRGATDVTVDVMQGDEPGRNRMVFSAGFPGAAATHRVQGSFEYDPR